MPKDSATYRFATKILELARGACGTGEVNPYPFVTPSTGPGDFTLTEPGHPRFRRMSSGHSDTQEEIHMSDKSRSIVLATAFAGALGAGLAFAPDASANSVAWGVSIGGPGFAIAAGQPAYWGGYRGYRYGYGYGHGYYRPYRPAVIYPAPVYAAPRPVYVVPRPVYVAPPAYYGYGY
jgi:hypothetical protein